MTLTKTEARAVVFGIADETAIRALLRDQGYQGFQQMAGYIPLQTPPDFDRRAADEAYILSVTNDDNHILAAAHYQHDLIADLILRGDWIALSSFRGGPQVFDKSDEEW